MTRLSWTDIDTSVYDAGVDRGVFYPQEGYGVPWNGLISVKEAPSGFDTTKLYIDGLPYQNQVPGSGFAATIDAYTYPEELDDYDGSSGLFRMQRPKPFGFTYRVQHGESYKIHLVYNVLANPSAKSNATLNRTTEPQTISWDFSTTPIRIANTVEGDRMSSHLVIDETWAYSWAIEAIEDILYGSDTTPPRFPAPEEVLRLFEDASIVKITDNGDGTWTADGPDDIVRMLEDDIFEIDWPTAVYIDDSSYTVSSL